MLGVSAMLFKILHYADRYVKSLMHNVTQEV